MERARICACVLVFIAASFLGQARIAFAEVALSNEVQVFVRPSVSCLATDGSASEKSLASFALGQQVFWKSTVRPSGSYTYQWSGDEGLSGTAAALPAKQYLTPGSKNAKLTVTPILNAGALPSGMKLSDLSVTAPCGITIVAPDLTASTPTVSPVSGSAVAGQTNTFYAESTLRFTGVVRNQNDPPTPATAAAPVSKTAWKIFEATAQNPKPPEKVKDQSLDSLVDTPALAIGANATHVREIANARSGTYYFGLCADNPGSIFELNEDNNCSPSWLTVTVVPKLPAKVDLTVDVVPTGNDDQQDSLTAPYGTTHILRWKSQNVSSCTGTGFGTGGALNNTDGVLVGPLVNEKNPYSISCTAASNATPASPSDEVGVTTNPPTVSCIPQPTLANVNDTITWSAYPIPDKYQNGVSILYGFSWTSAGGNPASFTGNPYVTKYAAANSASSATVTLSAPGSRTASATCPTVKIAASPDLTSSLVLKNSAGAVLAPNQPYFAGSGEKYTLSGTVFNTSGDADASGSFSNIYQYANTNTVAAPTAEGAWTDWSEFSMATLAKGASRAAGDYTWPPGVGKYWWFRICADQKIDGANGCIPSSGSIAEKSPPAGEENNTARIGPYEFIKPPENAAGLTFTCNDAKGVSTTEYEGRCTLKWSVQHVSSCTASNTSGDASWTGALPVVSGNSSNVKTSGPLTANTTFTITCKPLPNALSQTPVIANVKAVPFSAACSGSPNPQTIGSPVTWQADSKKLAAGNTYNYSWSGTDSLSASGADKQSVQKTYGSVVPPEKTATVSLSTTVDSVALGPKTSSCGNSVTITAPDLTANQPTVAGSRPTLDGSGKVIPGAFYEKTALTISGVINNVGDADTPNGTFNNSYQYATVDTGLHPADSDSRFSPFAKTTLSSGAKLSARGGSGTLGGHTWGEKGDISKGAWYFRICSDKPNSEVSEGSNAGTAEQNNCSDVRKITIVERPPGPAVNLLFDSKAGAAIIPYNAGGPLSWGSDKASSCTASNDGNRTDWSGPITPNVSGSKALLNLTRTTTFTLECKPLPGSEGQPAISSVTVVPFTPFCSVSPVPKARLGIPVTWTGSVKPSDGVFGYEWSGAVTSLDVVVPNVRYPTVGKRTGTFTVSATVNVNGKPVTFPKSVSCSTEVIAPDLTANTPALKGESAGATNVFYEGKVTISGSLNNAGNADLRVVETGFANQYEYRRKDTISWSPLSTVYLADRSRDFKMNEQGRAVQEFSWDAGAGEWEFRLKADTRNNITESNESNNESGILSVSLKERPPAPVPALSFNGSAASPQTVSYQGGGYLTWSCTNASSATASGAPPGSAFTGSVPLYGSGTGYYSGNLVKTAVFTITCTPLAGSLETAKSASVTVMPFSPRCSVPLESRLGETVTWSGSADSPTEGPYTFEWKGDVTGIDAVMKAVYNRAGWKTGMLSVSKTVSVNGASFTFPQKKVSCSTEVKAPDLTASLLLKDKSGAVLPPGTYWGGEEYTLVGTVKNDGNAPAPGIFSSYYHHAQSNNVGTDFVKTWLDSSADLLTGTSRLANAYPRPPETWKPLSVSPYYFSFCADETADNTPGYSSASGSVVEKDETNNCAVIGPYRFPPRPPAPTASILFNNTQGSVTVLYNQGGTVSWASKNASSCSASSAPDDVSNWRGGLQGAFGNVGIGGLKATHTFSLACQPQTGSLASAATDSVKVIPLSASCTGKPARVFVGEAVSWSATAQGGNGSYTYLWSGDDALSFTNGPKAGTDSVTKTYATEGNKTARVRIRSDSGESTAAVCSAEGTTVPYVVVKLRPVISIDLKLNGVDSPATNPLVLSYGATPMLSWTTTGTPDTCSASGDWSGEKITTGGSAQVGPLSLKSTYDFKISCTKTGALQPVEDTVRVRIAPVVSCKASKNPVFVGESMDWTATVNSVTQYTLLWSGTDGLSGSTNPLPKTYTTSGEKSATATVTADGIEKSAACTAPARAGDPGDRPTLTVKSAPDLTASAPKVEGERISAGFVAGKPLTLKDSLVTNKGTAPALIGANYKNVYQYRYHAFGNSAWTIDWSSLAPAQNFDDKNTLSAGASRPVPVGTLSATYVIPGEYELRVCADQDASGDGYSPSRGTISEDNLAHDAESEESNCSATAASARATVVYRPSASVDLVMDASPVAGNDSQNDTLTVSYNTTHTLRWASKEAKPGSCKSTGADSFTVANGATENGAGVSVGPLQNATYTYTIECVREISRKPSA